jgi:HSP20 family protein
MTLVRFKNQPANGSFNNLMDDFFPAMPSLLRDNHRLGLAQATPVNIRETEQDYVLDVVAPGLEKEDFKINLEQNTLTISAEKKAETGKEDEKHIRREYRFAAFKRSFTLDETIEAEGICAKYVNGVLTLNLPKRKSVKEEVKQITIQ